MESFAVFLEPYRNLISNSAAIVTHLHQLSGVVVCNNIRKKKSTDGFSVLPFLGGTVISSLVIRFGLILNDLITCRVGLIGAILNVGYICCFLYYSNDKNKSQALTKIGYGAALVVAILAYTFIENPNDMPLRFGLLFTVLIFLVVGSPLLGLPKIIRTKSTEGLPFPIILTGTLITFLWLLHGIVTRIGFVIFQNGVMFLLNVVQLSLFAIYPSKSMSTKQERERKKK